MEQDGGRNRRCELQRPVVTYGRLSTIVYLPPLRVPLVRLKNNPEIVEQSQGVPTLSVPSPAIFVVVQQPFNGDRSNGNASPTEVKSLGA